VRAAGALAVLLFAALAVARPALGHADVPWAAGVSHDAQQQANALFAEANQLFAQQAHAPALAKYRAAIALWDHPLIQFNMAVTLVRLDRVLEAADALDKALRFDAAPFPSQDQYQQALDYHKLVAGRVGTIRASCTQAGATLLLDGKRWFHCPGDRQIRVLAGEHTVVGEASGFLTISRRMVVTGGATATGTFTFVPLDGPGTLEYPSPRWLPWTVTGAGTAAAVGGLAFWIAGRDQMQQFRADFGELCKDSCSGNLEANATERQLAAQRDSAFVKNHVGIAMMSVGGAIAVGGVVWTILNRPRRAAVEIEPTARGASVRVRF
jgi:hypothetical protein